MELLKDEMEETTEQLVEVQREHRDRCKVGGGEGRGGEGDVPLPGGAAEGRDGGDDGTTGGSTEGAPRPLQGGQGGGEGRGGEGRGTYRYQVELLKDEMEETTEQLVEVQREHRDRCKVGGGEGRGGEGDVPLPGGAAEGRDGGDDGTTGGSTEGAPRPLQGGGRGGEGRAGERRAGERKAGQGRAGHRGGGEGRRGMEVTTEKRYDQCPQA